MKNANEQLCDFVKSLTAEQAEKLEKRLHLLSLLCGEMTDNEGLFLEAFASSIFEPEAVSRQRGGLAS